MNEPTHKQQTATERGQQYLAEACIEWREQPRTAMALALEIAAVGLAPGIVLAAACALVDAAVRDADDAAVRRALTEIALGLEGMSCDLNGWWEAEDEARWMEIEDAIEADQRERQGARRRRIALLCLLILTLGASIFLLSA